MFVMRLRLKNAVLILDTESFTSKDCGKFPSARKGEDELFKVFLFKAPNGNSPGIQMESIDARTRADRNTCDVDLSWLCGTFTGVEGGGNKGDKEGHRDGSLPVSLSGLQGRFVSSITKG